MGTITANRTTSGSGWIHGILGVHSCGQNKSPVTADKVYSLSNCLKFEGASNDGQASATTHIGGADKDLSYFTADNIESLLGTLYTLDSNGYPAFREFSEGSGSKDDPYVLKTKLDLIMLSQIVTNKQFKDYSNNLFVLGNAIDLENDTRFVGIGSGYNSFKGDFDGKGYTVSNFKIESAHLLGLGFFGVVNGEPGTKERKISNLNLNGSVKSTASTNNSAIVGGLVGKNAINLVISNCSYDGTVYSNYNSDNNHHAASGLVCDVAAPLDINKCYVAGKIDGFGRGGSFVGTLNVAQNVNISNSYSTATVTGKGSYTDGTSYTSGGLIGFVGGNVSGGKIVVNKNKANAGDVVEVQVTPKKGYVTKAGSVVYTYENDGTVTNALVNRVSENAVGTRLYFTMPSNNVTIYADFVSTAENNFTFDMVASSVRSSDETFNIGTLNAMSFTSRLYFEPSARNAETGVLTLKNKGVDKTVKEIGTLYAKTESLGATNELNLESVGSNGVKREVAYTSSNALKDKFSDLTNCYLDFSAKIAIDDGMTDYTVKSYIKFSDDTVIYSSERTDFANNVAERLGLFVMTPSDEEVTLTVSDTAVNNGFDGFGAVMYPWTVTCRKEGINVTLATIQAKKEVRLMSEAGIKKVRIIVPSFSTDYYDFTNNQAKALKSDWYTDTWVDMLTTLKNYKIESQLNLGWGTEFANSMQNNQITSVLGSGYSSLSFEEQVTAYGQLSAEFVRYLLSKGCTNITSVSFLSEPGNGWKGSDWDEVTVQSPQLNFNNTISAYDKCVKSVETEFDNLDIDLPFVYGNVSILYDPQVVNEDYSIDWWTKSSITWEGGILGLQNFTHKMTPGKDWINTMVNNATAKADAYSYHYYGKFDNFKVSNYNNNFSVLNAIKSSHSLDVNDIYMDEVSVKYYDSAEAENDKSKASAFEATQLAEYLAALMNNGYKGAYLWTFSDFSSDNMYSLMPNAISAVQGNSIPYDRYYAATLVTKYLNKCSTIYSVNYSDGCVTVKGTDNDGNTTVLVVNMNHVSKTVNVDLGVAPGKSLNRHLYNPSVNYRTNECKTIGADKTFESAKSFTDIIPAGGVAVYTTVTG